MQPTSDELYGQLQQVMDQYSAMAPANAGDVYSDLASRVDYFRPQFQELRGQEATAYATPAQLMNQYYGTYGGTEGPAAMTRLQDITGEVGRQLGTANVYRDVLNASRGNLQNMASDVLGQYNAMKDALMNQYQMKMPLYQSALSREENEKNRRAAGGGGGYGGFDWSSLFGDQGQQQQAAQVLSGHSKGGIKQAPAQKPTNWTQKIVDIANPMKNQSLLTRGIVNAMPSFDKGIKSLQSGNYWNANTAMSQALNPITWVSPNTSNSLYNPFYR